jgi:hypothetical protein
MIRETGDNNGNGHQSKRVSVRTGGAGHAHSGIVRSEILSAGSAVAEGAPPARRGKSTKIVRLGR